MSSNIDKSALQTWIENTIAGLKSGKTRTHIADVWASAYPALRAIESAAAATLGMPISYATAAKAVSAVRKAAKGRAAYVAWWLEIVRMPISEASAARTKALEVRRDKTRKSALKKITPAALAGMQARAISWLAQYDVYKLAAGIALLTGRRAVEVIQTGGFARTRGAGLVKFSGQAKTKGQAAPAYAIPVSPASAAQILAAVRTLRGLLPAKGLAGLTNEQLEAKANIQLGRAARALADGFYTQATRTENLGYGWVDGEHVQRTRVVPDITFHDLRKLYVLSQSGGRVNRVETMELLGHTSEEQGQTYERWAYDE